MIEMNLTTYKLKLNNFKNQINYQIINKLNNNLIKI